MHVSLALLLQLDAQWHIAACDLVDELRIGLEQHDMKVLDRMYTLQALPVLEPHHMIRILHLRPESRVHVVVDAPPRRKRQIIRLRIILEIELGPDDEMHDSRVYSIWPVVVKDLDIGGILKRLPSRNNRIPLQAVTQHKLHHAAIVPDDVEYKLPVAAQLRRCPLKQIDAVEFYYFSHPCPVLDLIIAVPGPDQPSVLVAEVQEEVGAGGSLLGQREVEVPVRKFLGRHDGSNVT